MKLSLIKSFTSWRTRCHHRQEGEEETRQNLFIMKFVPIIFHVHYYCNLHFMFTQLIFEEWRNKQTNKASFLNCFCVLFAETFIEIEVLLQFSSDSSPICCRKNDFPLLSIIWLLSSKYFFMVGHLDFLQHTQTSIVTTRHWESWSTVFLFCAYNLIILHSELLLLVVIQRLIYRQWLCSWWTLLKSNDIELVKTDVIFLRASLSSVLSNSNTDWKCQMKKGLK